MAENEPIEDAEVIDQNPDSATEQEKEQPQEKKAPKETPSSKNKSAKETPLPDSKSSQEIKGDGVQLDWGDIDDDDVINAFMHKQTRPSSAESAEPHLDSSEASEAEVMAEIRGENDDEEEEGLDEKDLLLAAELCIEMVDGLNSIAVGAFAKEPASTFELEGSKKKKLAILLAKVFYRYQAKVGPLATLILGLLLYLGMTWRMGYEVKKDKQAEAQKKAIEERKEKNRQKKEQFRNTILAAVGVEHLTLKDIAERMGANAGKIKPEIQVLCGQGLLFADHSKAIIHYRLAE